MKKSLFALAAVTAFAGAAQAQSSVTVYGIIDVGYIGGNDKTGAGAAKNLNTFGTSAESSSRLGFKGTEDLGGGLSAFFTVESDVNTNSTAAVTGVNNRQAFAGLKKKGIGQAAFGAQYTLLHDATSATSPTGNTNVMGDVIYPKNSGGVTAINGNANGSTIGYTLRGYNALKFQSDKFAGFGVNAFYNLNNSNTDQTAGSSTTAIGGTNNTTGWGVSADYTWKKLYATAVYQSFKSEVTAGATVDPAPSTNAAITGSVLTNTTDRQYYGAASYDFGILKAYAQYVNRKATSVTNSNAYASRAAQQIGVRSYLTPKIEAWASVGNGKYQAFGASQPTANFTGYQLGSNYWLSKRTNLYAIFGATGTTSTSANASYNGNNYAVGVRHTF